MTLQNSNDCIVLKYIDEFNLHYRQIKKLILKFYDCLCIFIIVIIDFTRVAH